MLHVTIPIVFRGYQGDLDGRFVNFDLVIL